jgi:uncharacterized protein DUF3631
VPIGEGQFEVCKFPTFAAMCFTSIDKLPTPAMQSRCIALPMKPATKEEGAKLLRFRASKCPELQECGRKFARWAADLTELPEVEPPDDFLNRLADNWRAPFQIAHLAEGNWPARVLAAARAAARDDVDEPGERGANGLLDAIWRVFAAATETNPRRMHTLDLVMQLVNLDDGRWRAANKGKEINEYFLRSRLKDYVVTSPEKGKGAAAPLRRWRAKGQSDKKWGYHELHLKDAFLRYLGRGLPSEAPPEPVDDAEDESPKHTSSSSKHPSGSGPSRP